MALTAFTSNFEDNSTDAGFQFTFFAIFAGKAIRPSLQNPNHIKKGGF